MIYDLDNNPISSHTFSIPSGDDPILEIRIDCVDGYSLFSDAVGNIAVEARKSGDVGWTNIETTPIDLSADNGTRHTFEVRLTAAVVTAITRRSFSLRVEHL